MNPQSTDQIGIFWFRRDLRLNDNHALFQALSSGLKILPIFIFDKNILNELPPDDLRVLFIYRELESLKNELGKIGKDLKVFHGEPIQIFRELLLVFNPRAIYLNRDYEPYARMRDLSISNLCIKKGIAFRDFKDHLIFEPGEIVKADGQAYTVFTPYSKRWIDKARGTLQGAVQKYYNSEAYLAQLLDRKTDQLLSLESIGFKNREWSFPERHIHDDRLSKYEHTRDFPFIPDGTSHLGVHLRFGTISIRELAKRAFDLSEKFLGELIWREFYAQILTSFPETTTRSFKQLYDRIEWRRDEISFERWCRGMTGYPLVDAGMRQLNQTGYMHNRLRMLTASFLCKHLLIDWRWGESYFAAKLLDYELSSNVGGWQWAAGCGTDAAPYFRIFNPILQQEKFDKNGEFIRQWIPEIDSLNYPERIIDHNFARQRCLRIYKNALNP